MNNLQYKFIVTLQILKLFVNDEFQIPKIDI